MPENTAALPPRPNASDVEDALAFVREFVVPVPGVRATLAAEVLHLRARIAELDKQLEPYLMLSPQQCSAGVHAEWLVDSEHSHACPWCRADKAKGQKAALRLVAGERCERDNSARTRCSDPDSGKVLGLSWWADAWCDHCIASAALDGIWPVVTDASPWGFMTPRGNIFGGGLQPADLERMARWGAEQCGGAVIREARPGVWVVAP